MAGSSLPPAAVALPPRDAQDDPETIDFFARYQETKRLESQLGKLESQKDKLIEDLLDRYELARSQFFDKLDEQSRLKVTSHGEAYVSVILNGDCMLFQDGFLLDGADGGRRAAQMLYDAAASHWVDIMLQLGAPQKVKVICRVYANFRSMAETTPPASTMDGLTVVEEFARGFSQAFPSFEFIDVRYENGVAEKMTESVSHQLGDHRCKRIILGCSTTAALAPFLHQLSATVPRSLDHIILLQGLPWHQEIFGTLFAKARYDPLFRTELPLQSYSPISQPPGLSSRKTSCASGVDSRVHTPAVPPETPASPGISTTSWAAKAKAAIHIPEPPSSPAARPLTPIIRKAGGNDCIFSSACAKDEHGILRNKIGQRVDPIPRTYNRDDVALMKQMKLCNVHFLRPPCSHSQACPHDHKYKMNKRELVALRLVARLSPCLFGRECDDAGCIYGHHCSAPERKDGMLPKEARAKGKTCVFGLSCRFPKEMHDQITPA